MNKVIIPKVHAMGLSEDRRRLLTEANVRCAVGVRNLPRPLVSPTQATSWRPFVPGLDGVAVAGRGLL
jgi:hypothetical protein